MSCATTVTRPVRIFTLSSALLISAGAAGSSCGGWEAGPGDPGLNAIVRALISFDDGSGPALFAGGGFTTAGGNPVSNVARWDGTTWSDLGGGMNGTVLALAVFDDGSGPALYAGGTFTAAGGSPASRIARWDGSAWSEVGGGLTGAVFPGGSVEALIVFDDGNGPALYAGGDLTLADGTVPLSNIARWDGTAWSAVGTGTNDRVGVLAVHDEGTGAGPALFLAGSFTMAGGSPAMHIARWDGAAFSSLGAGLLGPPWGLTSAVGTATPGLVAANAPFGWGGPEPIDRVSIWDGTAWSGMGLTVGHVDSLKVFDDGNGPVLYAGVVGQDGAVPFGDVYRWNGSIWTRLRANFETVIFALRAHDDGSGAGTRLYAAGAFQSMGGDPVGHIAVWNGCIPNCPGDLDQNGVVDSGDLLLLLTAWGPCPGQQIGCTGDLNEDGAVDSADLLLLLSNWGPCS